jgi:hypothetical protein
LDTECQEVAIDIRPDFEKHIEVRVAMKMVGKS